jgi:hypothetical protein
VSLRTWRLIAYGPRYYQSSRMLGIGRIESFFCAVDEVLWTLKRYRGRR